MADHVRDWVVRSPAPNGPAHVLGVRGYPPPVMYFTGKQKTGLARVRVTRAKVEAVVRSAQSVSDWERERYERAV